ncbi:S8 family peptidase [Kribbella sp. NPDC023855]|uniref:S8 family peptidase n=1 Tax=Kribbella sp. NPDC023855 TaxID=3154698 RepID=UPI0033FF7A8B
MPSHRWIPPLLATALALSLTPPPAHAAPPARTSSTTAAKPTTSRLTLITGDRVRITTHPGRPDQVSFEPVPGSRSDSAITSYSGGHTYVVPSAASADVASGRLDRTLFDVTTLIAEGRDDATSKTLPVIIRYSGTAAGALAKAKQTPVPGATKTRVLSSLGAKSAALTKTPDFWRSLTPGNTARVTSTVQRISLDRKVTVQLDQSVPQIGAPAAWQRGLTGKGVKVAVLDTGIDPMHPDVKGRIAAAENFTATEDAVDHNGHGTHVASITAGTGAASGGKYKGVAPEATLLNGKVLDDDGSGEFSGIIAGMEWAAAQGASVINMSLGGGPSDGTDDLSQAVNRISRSTGTLFVIAAGNCFATGPFMVSSPAAADDALAVGNLQRDGSLNRSSCRGPRKGDGALKPEISAPGTDIVAARAAGTSRGEPVDDNYTTLSGTSMASPHVAGTAALVAQANPDWKAAQLKARLISTADPQQGSRVDEQGAGRVDADQATDQSVTVDTGELELGILRWPYPATDPVSRELTYHNPTSTPVTLSLATTMEPAPKLSASQLVVPAGGEAKVTVTADRAAAGQGIFSGRITATAAGSDPIVTTIGWYAEAELYELTINGIQHDGSPATADVIISRLDGEPLDLGPFGLPMRNGKASLRVPPGKYEATTILFGATTDSTPQRFDLVTSPETAVTKDATITLDGRKTAVVETTVEGRPDLRPRSVGISYLRTGSDGLLAGGSGISLSGAPRTLAASPTAKATIGTSEFSTGGRLEVPPYQASVVGGQPIDAADFVFGPRFTGTKTLQLYDAGAANPGELDGVRGKLALIRYTNEDPRYNGQLVKLAEDAGAAAALLYNPDVPGNNGVFSYWAYGEPPEAKIPAFRTSRKHALAMIEQLKTGPVSVKLTGTTSTPVVYDYTQPWANHIPAGVRLVLEPAQLARVDDIIGAHTEGTQVSETRTSTTPMGSYFGTWLPPVLPTPLRRTSYVLANGMQWHSSLILDNGGFTANTLTPQKTYRAGARTTERWIAPVENSGLPATPTQAAFVSQDAGSLVVMLSPFRRGPAEFADPFSGVGEFALSVERDGQEIASASDPAVFVETPADAAQYRVILDAKRENTFWKYSTQVKSVWSFKSSGDAQEVMPLVLADLDVPQADDLNQVKTGQPTVITFGLRHQAGSSTKAKFTSAKLELSYDGTHWTALPLAKVADGKYITAVTHPASQAGNAPSLRLTATDEAGGKLEQQVSKAYGLK